MNKPGPRPVLSLNEMLGRLILAILIIAAFLLLGLWLRSGSLLDWFATTAVMALSAFFGGVFRGTPLDATAPRNSHRRRFTLLLEALSEHPVLSAFATNITLRIAIAAGFGIVVASLEQLVTLLLFGWTGWSTTLTGLGSLSLVIFPIYFLLGLWRARHGYRPSSWMQKLRAGIADALNVREVPLGPVRKSLSAAGLRTLASVLLRGLAVLILPVIFSNWFAVAFVAVTAVALIVGGETLLFLVRAANRSMTPRSDTEPTKENNHEQQ